MRWPLVILVILPLFGCFDDQKRQLAQCRLDASKPPLPTGIYQPTSQIRLCMEAAGYDWVGFDQDERCNPSDSLAGNPNPFCFRPSGFFARLAFRIDPN
jgi:hypothetical protein